MTGRSVPEWVGATADSSAPPRVRLRIFERCEGRCHISGRKIMAGEKWELEHIKALCLGGENRESNLAPALVGAHRKKTRADLADKAKADRTRQKHLGIYPPSLRPLKGRGFPKRDTG